MDEPYVRGDLFCFHDYILFLIFEHEPAALIRAGIVYEARTPEPFASSTRFARDSQLAQRAQNGDFPVGNSAKRDAQGFRTSSNARTPIRSTPVCAKRTMSKRILAASKLEDEALRVFLRPRATRTRKATLPNF
jgi:hypothetical protein